jgi:flavin-binding protein dodecin
MSVQGHRDQLDVGEELRRCINQGIARAGKTIRNIRSAWIKEQQVRCEDGKITQYQVNLSITFVLDE